MSAVRTDAAEHAALPPRRRLHVDGLAEDARAGARDFLMARRGDVTPESWHLVGGGDRRVPGLRREEVAMLAGVSVDYYAQLERGDLSGASVEVLDAVAYALRLDPVERRYLDDLARTIRGSAPDGPAAPARLLRPSVHLLLEAIAGVPAWVRDARMEFVAANPLARALYAPVFARRPANNAMFFFLAEQEARAFYPDWEQDADGVVATLRAYAGRFPADEGIRELVALLTARSRAFAARWRSQEVRMPRPGVKRIVHPVVGELRLGYEVLDLPTDPGLTAFAFTAAPGSETAARLRELAAGLPEAGPSRS